MKDDRESRESLRYFFKYIKSQWRWNEDTFLISRALLRTELICAVRCSDSDSK